MLVHDFWLQEHVGCFNSSMYFNYGNYRNLYPIWALGEFRRRLLERKKWNQYTWCLGYLYCIAKNKIMFRITVIYVSNCALYGYIMIVENWCPSCTWCVLPHLNTKLWRFISFYDFWINVYYNWKGSGKEHNQLY